MGIYRSDEMILTPRLSFFKCFLSFFDKFVLFYRLRRDVRRACGLHESLQKGTLFCSLLCSFVHNLHNKTFRADVFAALNLRLRGWLPKRLQKRAFFVALLVTLFTICKKERFAEAKVVTASRERSYIMKYIIKKTGAQRSGLLKV